MTAPAFAHLHVHTHYSLLDGACKIPNLVKRVKELGMTACGITDHGSMFGVIEFYNECKKEGIKPLVGIEAYMAPGDRRDRQQVNGETAFHLLLLAQDIEGYRNLMKLSSLAYKEGFYYKPRVDKEILREYSKGIIATSACLGGEVCSAFMKRDYKHARAVAETYAEIFGPDRFFIEVQKQGIKEQDMVNPELADLADKLGVGLVATNDVHFLNKDDHYAHDVLCCISMGRLVNEENRLKYPTELYLKSPAEMADIGAQSGLSAWTKAMENTARVAAMCNLEIDFSKRYAPVYRVPAEKIDQAIPFPSSPKPVAEMKDDERYLRQLCETGLTWRYGSTDVRKEIRERLEYELKVIISKNFCSYFLIVWDFCNYARDHGIPVGARGSGVGTMVGYLLGLCNVDPIKYNLLFERFMDPSRSEMPDIDIDICQDGRQGVIEYVRNKYGHVAQIITFGTLAAKAACKDVGRVLGVPLADIDKLTKLIPGTPGMTLKKALDQVPDLAELHQSNPVIKQVIDLAQKLEGLCRNAGCHAAGVIIADTPLDTIVPLYKDKDDNILTQFEGPVAEKCGLLKMDFLGLRTLTVLTRSVDLELSTRQQRAEPKLALPHPRPPIPFDEKNRIDLEKIDLTDKNVLALFCRGETRGVFQFESGGMQDLLMKMQPDRIEDLIAANALYRPGPMELIPLYCNRKHGKEPVPQVHPIMDQILAETYGIMCIHEDARIALADGSEKPIKEIRRGDLVHSVNRATGAVEVRECHGCGPTRSGDGVKITLENGFSVTLTDDHNVFTFDGMKEAGQLDPEADLVMVPRHARQDRPTARHIAPWLGADTDVAYLLGSLVGDGCLTTTGITIATGREEDHLRFVAWIGGALPSVHVHGYFHGRCWYVTLSHHALLNDPARGNRKTRLNHFIESLDMRVKAKSKRVPEVIFRCNRSVRAAFLAGLLDADGCTATNKKGHGVCFLSSASVQLLEDVRRLAQLEGIPVTIRKNRIQFWDLVALDELLSPHLLVRKFVGTLTRGDTVGWIPRPRLMAAVPAGESSRAFSLRTGIVRQGMLHDFPFVKSSTAAKAGIDLADLRYYRIARIERVSGQQFYGMSVAEHHNLVANGIVVKNCYQEQVMQVFNQLGGIELANAYKLIKAISKKMVDVIAKFRPEFLKGTMAKGVSQEKAEEIFELILKFGGYGFNKSHSSRYAIVAFQTAYMKVYHPVEFMSAVLTYEMGSTDKMVEYIDECRRVANPDGRRGIKVLPPDVNISDKDFTPVYQEAEEPKPNRKSKIKNQKSIEGVIRFGMMAVRGVGEKAVEAVIEERQRKGAFANLYDFCERVDLRQMTRATIESLVKCGAFSSMGATRAAMLQVLEKAVEMGQQTQDDKRNGQLSMFGAPAASTGPSMAASAALPDVEEIPNNELLKFEKEFLGFYITSHPLTEHQTALSNFSTHSTKEAQGSSEGSEVIVGGMISRVKKVVTKNGRSAGMQMAIITLEDLDGPIDGTLFAESFAAVQEKYPDAIASESIVFVKGKVDKKRETPSLLIDEVIPVSEAIAKFTTSFVLKMERMRHNGDSLALLRPLLKQHAGKTPVFVQVPLDSERNLILKFPGDLSVRPSKALQEDVERLLGSGSAEFKGAGSRRRRNVQQTMFASTAEQDEPTNATPLAVGEESMELEEASA